MEHRKASFFTKILGNRMRARIFYVILGIGFIVLGLLGLGRGCRFKLMMDLVSKTHPDTEKLLQANGIEYYIEETKTAVAHFNQLSQQGIRVGGIFHSTC